MLDRVMGTVLTPPGDDRRYALAGIRTPFDQAPNPALDRARTRHW